MPMTPSIYAAHYLPVVVPAYGTDPPVSVKISRYRLYNGDADSRARDREKDNLLGALGRHLATNQKQDKDYSLELSINGKPYEITDANQVNIHAWRPFLGKGSPEECELVLTLALLVYGKRPGELQKWADTNLGLDCNGFVGNYVFHEWMGNDWDAAPPHDNPKPPKERSDLNGPSANIETLFHSLASGPHEEHAIKDIDELRWDTMYLVARVDPSTGSVIGGSPVRPHGRYGHIAITESGPLVKPYTSNSRGQCNPTIKQLDMCDRIAIQTVESGGPVNGVGVNWMVFTGQHSGIPKVFVVNRDKTDLRFADGDYVKIAPLLSPDLI